MSEQIVTVGSRIGLHARPASLFVQAAARQPVPVQIGKPGGEPVDARSILLVLGLDVRGGDEVVLSADGEGADRALNELAALVSSDLDAAA
jgi:phosphocarrier protein